MYSGYVTQGSRQSVYADQYRQDADLDGREDSQMAHRTTAHTFRALRRARTRVQDLFRSFAPTYIYHLHRSARRSASDGLKSSQTVGFFSYALSHSLLCGQNLTSKKTQRI